MVSIVMPVYNNIDFIHASIASVLGQSYRDWELWIIDDGSSVEIRPYLEKYLADGRIHYFKQPRNMGVAAARNKAMELASGRYIAFLDSDDIWLPEKLERQLAFMEEKQAAISCTQYRSFVDDVFHAGKLIDVEAELDYEGMLHGNHVGCLTVMIDREYVKNIKMPAIRHEDYCTWLNIAKAGHIVYGLKEDLARYRLSAKSVSSNKWKSMKWTWEVYRENQGLSLMKSMECFVSYILWNIRKRV